MISQTKEERWHFTKAQADTIYKRVIANSRKKLPGVSEDYMRCKVNGEWFYRVNYLSLGDQRNYIRDLWGKYGYLTYYNNKYGDGIYVRRA